MSTEKRHQISLGTPAETWDEGFPLGNGRLGAMVMGIPDEEIIHINEESMWYGGDHDSKNPDTRRYLEEIRSLLMKGETKKAQFLARMAMTSAPKYHHPYQPAGNMRLCFCDQSGEAEDYSRILDIDRAAVTVAYRMRGTVYQREHFVSEKYQVFVTRLTCSASGGLTLSANMNRRPFEDQTGKLDGQTVYNCGRCGEDGVSYFTGIRMAVKGGSVDTIGDFVYASGADEVYLYLACSTDYQDPDYRRHALERLDEAQKAGYQTLKEEHERDFARLYDRMELSLGGSADEMSDIFTDEMLSSVRRGEDTWLNTLTETLFAFARYLLIACSTDCLLPANLQGIWNGDYVPSWESEYTININEQMNYWMAEKCGLSECQLPVAEQVGRMSVRGRKTAEELYGCRGFCAHHNTDLWAHTDPEGIYNSSPFWPMGGAWLCLHLYDHYLYTMDREFLREKALPVMREAIRFFEDYLYETEDGKLITGPSISPENSYLLWDGTKAALCMGPAMDIQILRQLITDYLKGCADLGYSKAESETDTLNAILERLPEIGISSDGRIMEWMEEYEEAEPGHRHMSPLFALHPGNQITSETPELFRAARKTLDKRLENGGGQTGWSRAWAACFAARLYDGKLVGESVRILLERSIKNNLFNLHPPFQIDGNFGIAEAICEALIQSHNGYIDMLPALPPEWKSGKVKGIVLQGAITADFEWKDGELKSLILCAKEACSREIRYRSERKQISLPAGTAVTACPLY